MASQYYAKCRRRSTTAYVLLIDPMLATGGSAVAALDLLPAPAPATCACVCIVAAPEGVAAVERRYPAVPIYTPVVDRELNAQKFIVPGLGDFGDRLYRHRLAKGCPPVASPARIVVLHDSRRALGSAVEHRLHTAGVGGSNPPARTT